MQAAYCYSYGFPVVKLPSNRKAVWNLYSFLPPRIWPMFIYSSSFHFLFNCFHWIPAFSLINPVWYPLLRSLMDKSSESRWPSPSSVYSSDQKKCLYLGDKMAAWLFLDSGKLSLKLHSTKSPLTLEHIVGARFSSSHQSQIFRKVDHIHLHVTS